MIRDCRLFSDKIPEARGHTGAHAKFLDMLACKDERFPDFIRGLRDEIFVESKKTGASLVHVSLFCRAGLHRSVACAILLSHCLEQNGFCMVRDINFLTKCFWGRGTCGGSCQWCWISGPMQLCPEAIAMRQNALHHARIAFESGAEVFQ